MTWKQLNKEAWYAEFHGWHVTKNFVIKDLYGIEEYEYIATKDGNCYKGNNWKKIESKILMQQVKTLDL